MNKMSILQIGVEACSFSPDSSLVAYVGVNDKKPVLGILRISSDVIVREKKFDENVRNANFVRFVHNDIVAMATKHTFLLYNYVTDHLIHSIVCKSVVQSFAMSAVAPTPSIILVSVVYYRKGGGLGLIGQGQGQDQDRDREQAKTTVKAKQGQDQNAPWFVVTEQLEIKISRLRSNSHQDQEDRNAHKQLLSPLPPKCTKTEWAHNTSMHKALVEISHCGTYIICGTRDEKSLTLYSRDGEVLWVRHHQNTLQCCRFSEDGKYLAYISEVEPHAHTTPEENHTSTANRPSICVHAVENGEALHYFQLNPSFKFCAFYASSIIATCSEGGISFWNVSEDVDPLPHEIDVELFFTHYVSKRPHLLYRGDNERAAHRRSLSQCDDPMVDHRSSFDVMKDQELVFVDEYGKSDFNADTEVESTNTLPCNGSTILHRLVSDYTAQDLHKYLKMFARSVEQHYCVDINLDKTSLESALRNIDAAEDNWTSSAPDAVARGVWPLLPVEDAAGKTPLCLAVDKKDEKKIRLLLEFYAIDLSPFAADLPTYTNLLAKPSLSRVSSSLFFQVLEKSIVRVPLGHSQCLKVRHPRPIGCDSLIPDPSFWAKVKSDPNGYEIETEAYSFGYANFITLGGTFDSIVRRTGRSGNLQVFESEAMKFAIQYKWELYGEQSQTCFTSLFVVMCVTFGFTEIGGSGCAVVSSFCGILLMVRELLEVQGSYARYLSGPWNLFDFVVLLNVFILNVHGMCYHTTEISSAVDVSRAFTYLIMGIDMLNYLRPYSNYGAFISMIEQIFLDAVPFIVVMLIFLLAVFSAYLSITRVERPSPMGALYIIAQLTFGGGYDVEDFETTDDAIDGNIRNSALKFLVIFYLFINIVILLNLLIAIMGDSYAKVREKDVVSKAANRALILNDIDNSFGWALAWMCPERAKVWYPKYLHVLTNRALRNTRSVDSAIWEGGVKELKHAIKLESERLRQSLTSGVALLKATITADGENKTASEDEAVLNVSESSSKNVHPFSPIRRGGSGMSVQNRLDRMEGMMLEMRNLMLHQEYK
jgi:hypothetical protein